MRFISAILITPSFASLDGDDWYKKYMLEEIERQGNLPDQDHGRGSSSGSLHEAGDVDAEYREFMLSALARQVSTDEGGSAALKPDHPHPDNRRASSSGSLHEGDTGSLEPEKPLPDQPPASLPGHCELPTIPASGLFKKSELIDTLPDVGPEWVETLGLMKSIWNANVVKTSPTLRIPKPGSLGAQTVELLASGFATSVWKLSERGASAILKFETNCLAILRNRNCPKPCTSVANEQPLLMEFIVSEIVCKQDESICPRILKISPEAPVSMNVFADLKLEIEHDQSTACLEIVQESKSLAATATTAKVVSPTFRTIQETFVGPSIGDIFKGVSSPIERAILAGQVFIKTIDLLQRLHQKGFIHGDIHKDNIALRRVGARVVSGRIPELTLIDFGLAKFYPLEQGTRECVGDYAYHGMAPIFLSKFQLEGFRSSRRDDVYRAFEVFLFLVTNGEYWKLFGGYGMYSEVVKVNFNTVSPFEPSQDALGTLKWKGTSAIVYKGIGPLKDLLSPDVYHEVLGMWRFIHRYVSSGIKIDEKPNYGFITFLMSKSLGVIDEFEKSSAATVSGFARSVSAESA